MSTAKHTPGPWKKDKYGSLRGGNGKQVVTKSSGLAERSSTGSEEEYANATLVAAAPELLSLLECAACPQCDGSGAYYDSHGEVYQCQWCYEREAVLMAAKGDQP